MSNKYKNVPTAIDGIRFHSKKEGRRYLELKAMLQAGLIEDLRRQVYYDLDVNGVHIAKYVADFVYFDTQRQEEVVEDPKGVRTQVYKIKKRLMKAVHDIEVEEP